MSDSEGYEGWANRDTWLVSMWLNNDYDYYHSVLGYTRELVREGLPKDEIRKLVQKRIRTESRRIKDPRDDFKVHYRDVAQQWIDDVYDFLLEEVSE